MVAFSEPGTTAALLRTALRSSVIVAGVRAVLPVLAPVTVYVMVSPA